MKRGAPPFLKRVFKYRASEARTPTEDFLSEVLADFLIRAPKSIAATIIGDCFIPPDLGELFYSIASGEDLNVRTQVYLPSGKRLDLLIEISGNPIIIIKSKIYAPFQRRARAEDDIDRGTEHEGRPDNGNSLDADPKYDHQLISYGQWLRGTSLPSDWPGVLTVLTHAVPVPLDFNIVNTNLYGAVPHKCYWRNLHAKLCALLGEKDEGFGAPAWSFIGKELCRFLEGENMDSTNLTSVDIAAINVGMAPNRKLSGSFVEVSAELIHAFAGEMITKWQGSSHDPENSRAWGWTYFNGPEQIYVGYGLYFSPLTGEMDTAAPPLTEHEHAFIAIGADKVTFKIEDTQQLDGWSQIANFLAIKPIPLNARQNEERFPEFLVRLLKTEWQAVSELKHRLQSNFIEKQKS